MPRVIFALVCAFVVAGSPESAWSQTADELKQRIERLERENASLRKENVTLRNRVIALEGGSAGAKVAKGDPKDPAPVTRAAAVVADGPKWSPWLEFGGTWSSERSRGEAGLFSPLWQSPNTLVFTDLRGKLFEENVTEGNFAIGMRHMLPSGWNLGAWAGYDVRRSTSGNVFHQAAFGVEALHPDWDFRLNGYVPITGAKAGGSLAEVQLSGNQIFMIGGREVPLYGADFETGVKLYGDERGNEFRLYTGGFWFDHEDALQKIAGPKARAELRLAEVLPSMPGSRLTLEAGIRYDEVRKTDWEVGAKLRIPFGGGVEQRSRTASLTAQERRMTEALQRDTDVVTARSGQESVSDAITGVRLDRVVLAADHGNSVSDASNAGGDNTLVIATGTVSGAQTLQGSQTLQGGGSTIRVRGQKSGIVAGFTAAGAAATLDTPGNAPNLTLAGSNAHVAGIGIQGSGDILNDGISGGSGKDNVAITQTSVAGAGANGVRFDSDNSNVTISGTSVVNVMSLGRGIHFGNDNSNVTISGTSIANVGGDGIGFAGGNTNVIISGTSIADVGGSGLSLVGLGNSVVFENSTLAGTFGDSGILIHLFSTGITLNGAGNTAAGATFGDNLCDSVFTWNGTVVFDGVPITEANCP